MGLLSTPLSVGTKAVRGLMDMSTSARMQRAEDMGFDTNTNWYHGTNDLENIAKTGFDPSFTGKGNDQFGSGFYFSTRPSQASSFATNLNTNKAGEVQPAGIIKANLALKNPLVVDGTKVSNINELPIDLSSDDVRELLEYSTALKRSLDDEQMNPMGDHFSEFWDDGPTDEMMEKLVDTYTNSNLSAIEGDLFDGNATAFREGLAKVTGYDGIVIDFGDGFKNAVAWKPEQVRSTSAKFDPRKANRGDLIASNPVATAAAGAGGLLAMTGSEDSEAGVVGSLVKMLAKGKAGGTVVNYPDELIESTPFELRKAIADHNEGILGTSYREGMEASPTYYHGTGAPDISVMRETRSGKAGQGGVYFTDSPDRASKYAELAGKLGRGDSPNVIPSKLNLTNPFVSTKGMPYNANIQSLKNAGHDGIILKGEMPDGGDEVIAFSPSQVRVPTAVFDPAKASSSNLLASNPIATTSAGLLANMTGQPSNLASYMQGNTDAYLTAQERAYLNNRQEFDDFFSDDTGYVRADVLPFRTNENTGDSEFATPQMIKGLLSSLYDLGQSPRSGIYNQQSILDLI